MNATRDTTDDSARNERKRRYEAVLRTVEHQTAPGQGIDLPHLAIVLVAHGGYTRDELESSVRAARENGDLYRWRDGSGRWQYTVADERNLVALWHRLDETLDAPVDRLRSLLGVIVEETDVDRETVGELNQRIAEVSDD